MNSTDSGAAAPVRRRTLATGAAWSVPVIAFGAVAPRTSASPTGPPPGLQGWVLVRKACVSGTDTLDWDSSPGTTPPADPYVPDQWGLWVYDTYPQTGTPRTEILGASITVHVPTSAYTGTPTFTLGTGASGWSTPVTVPSSETGYVWYRTDYSGTWTYHAAAGSDHSYTKADGRIHLTAQVNLTNSSCVDSGLELHIERCVTIRTTPPGTTQTICFERIIHI